MHTERLSKYETVGSYTVPNDLTSQKPPITYKSAPPSLTVPPITYPAFLVFFFLLFINAM